MLTDTLLRIPLNLIEVPRHERQRRELDVSNLLRSIRERGVVTPIIVERTSDSRYILVAGERRLQASRELKLRDIPARLVESLSGVEKQIIELEENIKRSDLHWQDFCYATRRIHLLYQHVDHSWTQAKTAESLSIEDGTLSIILRVATELVAGNKLILEAPNYRAAYNVIARRESRKIDDVYNTLMGGEDALEPEETQPLSSNVSTSSTEGQSAPPSREPRSISDATNIQNVDFLRWAPSFTGQPFTFLHCDFPYGIKLDKSDQGNSATWGAYGDSPEVYWELCRCLAENLDKLMAPSSHLMFWLSSDFHIIEATLQFFSAYATSLDFNPKPLIWHKTDGKGILPDPRRGPRHVYETAIFASRGDRLIATSVADAFGHPKGEASHQSEKPEPMLRHFFRMFIDEGTTFLDPTCGSGSSLCAAEGLGAKVTGLEINPEWADDARSRLRKSRLLRDS